LSTFFTIDLGALKQNYLAYCDRILPAECAAVVKADAYGLGADRVASALFDCGCRRFFTATGAEGVSLRNHLESADIYVLGGVSSRTGKDLLEYRLVPVLNSPDQLGCWVEMARLEDRPLPAVIHIDTGMTRLGFDGKSLERLHGDKESLRWLDIHYVMTHFACADEIGNSFTVQQLERFNSLRRWLPPAPTSLGNSAGVLRGRNFSGDLARVGIGLFGGHPIKNGKGPGCPVVKLESELIQLRCVQQESPVGYGGTARLPAGTWIATIGIGYADGYPCSLGNKGIAFIDGRKVKVVGSISMDTITVDVTGLPEESLQPGTQVELIGLHFGLEEFAELAGTISYEILTHLGKRAHRIYVDPPSIRE
jgi:alanine racemase